jgi:putative sterol carrier protein
VAYVVGMDKYPFLSDEWITETRAIREEFLADHEPPSVPSISINLVVTDVPFGSGEVDAHFDSSHGAPEIDLEHLPKVNATITVGYETAKNLLINGQMSSALEAMQLGRIKVKGNMFKLLGLAKVGKDPASRELAGRIREITE